MRHRRILWRAAVFGLAALVVATTVVIVLDGLISAGMAPQKLARIKAAQTGVLVAGLSAQVIPLAAFVLSLIDTRRQHRAALGRRCPRCGYPLPGRGARACPACGREAEGTASS